jgi:hypothetical protein
LASPARRRADPPRIDEEDPMAPTPRSLRLAVLLALLALLGMVLASALSAWA